MSTERNNVFGIKTVDCEARLSSVQKNILNSRYLFRDKETGLHTETINEFYVRVPTAIADAEKKSEDKVIYAQVFYDLFAPDETGESALVWNTPALVNAGIPGKQQLSACFTLDIKDDLGSIMDTLKQAAMVFQTAGGVGFSFDSLRERGSKVSTSGGESSGPVSFMSMFDSMCSVISSANHRRGAMMALLSVSHPDIMEFIYSKTDEARQKLKNFNISVMVPNSFMLAVENDLNWNLISPKDKKVVKTVKAKEIWNALITSAHTSAEPGILFTDTIEEFNGVAKSLGACFCNPCAEVVQPHGSSCNIGNINIAHNRFAAFENNKRSFNIEEFKRVCKITVRSLDNIIDINDFTDELFAKVSKLERRVSTSLMGVGDLFILLGIAYDSEEALKLIEQIGGAFKDACDEASEELAVERGEFPLWQEAHESKPHLYPKKRRNVTTRTIAPTGSTSIIAATSSGVEPVYSWVFTRNNTIEKDVKVYHRFAKEYLEKGLPLPSFYRSAMDISSLWHVKILAQWQRFVDLSISKTINAPESATVEEVEIAYKEAWKLGCKCVSYYRDNSRPGQVLVAAKEGTENKCPVENCEGTLVYEEKCVKCKTCNFSKCNI